MGRKSFKEKEQAYLEKNKISSESTEIYIPSKRKQDEAIELLKEKGFHVTFIDSILYCECKDNEEYKRYESVLLEHFGIGGKVAFSFGASIKNYTEPEIEEPER